MPDFFKPADLQEALRILSAYKDTAVVVNGGSDIVISITQKRIKPEAIVYIGDLEELKFIYEEDAVIHIGGSVTYADLMQSAEIKKITGLTVAVSNLGSPGVRAIATPAGNIETAAPAADCATMLMALGATVVLSGIDGKREISLSEYFAGRNKTVRLPGEIISEIQFPALSKNEGTGYCKVARRKAQDIGKILVGARVKLDGDTVAAVQISLGALNTNIVRARQTEADIKNMKTEEAMHYFEEQFPKDAKLRASYFREYKEAVTSSVICRAFANAVKDAEKRMEQKC